MREETRVGSAWADEMRARIVADLTRADHVPSDTFDCIIFVRAQTLQMIYDVRPEYPSLMCVD